MRAFVTSDSLSVVSCGRKSDIFESFFGSGILSITASRIASTFTPVFADTGIISSFLHPRRLITSSLTLSISALGRSILLSTGMISRLFSSARYTFESVCASIPWLASTTRIAHSTDASERETSY